MRLIKSHAYGNDFLLLDEKELGGARDHAALARTVCDRHRGIGADGLLMFSRVEPDGPVSMRLLNADGSDAEISGNGLRCLAAWMARDTGAAALEIDTAAGRRRLDLLEQQGSRLTFRAAMGRPEDIREERLAAAGEIVTAVTLRVGNPQCVVLGEVSIERLQAIGRALSVHPRFPAGTNVELAAVESPHHVRILIWERGVGPTEASGTGACAAAVAAMQFGGAARDLQVESPGGTQRVEWQEDGLYLTGWAELVGDVQWLANHTTSRSPAGPVTQPLA